VFVGEKRVGEGEDGFGLTRDHILMMLTLISRKISGCLYLIKNKYNNSIE